MRTLSARTSKRQQWAGRGLWRVKVNSEQVSFESFAESGERICSPDTCMHVTENEIMAIGRKQGQIDIYDNWGIT